MKEQLQERLNILKAEFDAGQKMMAELNLKRSSLESTILRISGAMQVVEELLKKTDDESKSN